jgi:hypothetical protein
MKSATTTCLDDAHSRYLHTVLEKKIQPDDMKILGIKEVECARRQYLKLSRIYHPDKCTDVHANELFLLVSNSFNKLTSGCTRGGGSTTASSELTLKESLLLFIKIVVGEYGGRQITDADCEMLAKMVLSPEDLTWNDKLSLTCTIYKLFVINKNE